jgi:hypothetical protein
LFLLRCAERKRQGETQGYELQTKKREIFSESMQKLPE